LLARRTVQLGILVLFLGAHYKGWEILTGNLSAAHVLGSFYLADPFAAIQMLAAGMAISLDLILGAVIVGLFYALIAGRSFCSWVCPVNVVTDAAIWLRKKMGLSKLGGQIRINRNTRLWVLGLSLLMSLILGVAAFEFISPIALLHRGIVFGIGLGWLAILVVFFFDLVAVKHGWCGHLCPLGAFYAAISPRSLIRVQHEKEKCTDCLDCKIVCPEVQVLKIIGKSSGPISFGACTNCGRCIEVCEDKALKFSITNPFRNA